MVKRRKKNTRKNRIRKGFCKNRAKARIINASTPFETCIEQLSPFGGLLALIKFFDLVNFHKIFNYAYQQTKNPRFDIEKINTYKIVQNLIKVFLANLILKNFVCN